VSEEDYLEDYPLVTAKEEKELLIKAHAGDKEAFDYLVVANTRLVKEISKKFEGNGIDKKELIQEGVIGLIKAIRRFDVTKEVKLSTYSYIWIQQHMERVIQNHSRMIRIPCFQFQKNFTLSVARKKLEQKLGRKVEDEELATYTGETVEEIKKSNRSMIDTFSYDIPCKGGEDDTTSVIEMIADEVAIDIVSEITTSEIIKNIKKILTEDEFSIFEKKLGINGKARSCKEIAAEHDIPVIRVSRIYRICLGKLKRNKNIRMYK